ncbi:MAG: Holliday junction branch migration protein RuvA [Syntrophomonadaceae bacterium]|jgi:Holliday junction DNA helicase RuvA|nr:Holliday junction branch migration protein RuvA [Syntrophomonadaceae bacterium]
MISFVRGTVFSLEKDYVIVDSAAGLGYQITVADKVVSSLEIGNPVLLYTYMQVLDNEIKLYGFLEKEELDLFLKITAISGMGARAALNVLGTLPPNEFYQAVISQDEKTLNKIPGIGKKSAQRLIFEFKDKVELQNIHSEKSGAEISNDNYLLEALEVLGYKRNEIMPLLLDLKSRNELDERPEENIKKILRYKAMTVK